MNTNRRNFLKKTSLITGGALLGGTSHVKAGSDSISNLIKIDEPFHGAIFNRRLGQEEGGRLKIKVQGQAPLGCTVIVNGVEARRSGTMFTTEIYLQEHLTDITALAIGWFGENKHTIRVVWDKNSFPRYRFSIDDNIFFLRDIARSRYNSLFDCFYLKGLRDLNNKYGTKFVLNIYYSDGLEYTDKEEFLISDFPDKYKSEWKDNSDWLKLAFHAYSNLPDRPYQYASPTKLISDLQKVKEQIYRFAGEQTYSPPTVIHWGMVQPTALKVLSEHGVKVLSGFTPLADGRVDVNYLLDDVRSEYVVTHDVLMDFENDIVFSNSDITCNNVPIDAIVPLLEPLVHNPYRAEIMDLFTHEQYFWPFYVRYVPDHFERLDKAIQFVTEHGYKPVFFHEGLMGAPE